MRGPRRQGFSFVEIVFAVLVVALPLLAVMTLIGSNVRGTAHNRERATVQILLANMVDRYGSLSFGRLQKLFADGEGGAEAIDADPILNSGSTWTSAQLVSWGYRRECFLQVTGGTDVGAVLYLLITYRDVFGRLQRAGLKRVVGTGADLQKAEEARRAARRADEATGDLAGSMERAASTLTNSRWLDGGAWGSRRGAGRGDEDGEYGDEEERRRGDEASPLASERRALRLLIERLRSLDAADGSVDYPWDAVGEPDEDGGALARVCELLATGDLPDGDYPYTFRTIDYRAVDPDFGSPLETLELVVLLLDDPVAGHQRMLLLERHLDRRRPEPVCRFLNGRLLRSEGMHLVSSSKGGRPLTCAAVATPERLFVGRPGTDPDGRPSDTVYLLHIRRFAEDWTYERQQRQDAVTGGTGDSLEDEIGKLFSRLGVDPAPAEASGMSLRDFGF